MIHTVYTMTVGRYGQLDRSQDSRLLRRWYNPFPVKWFQKRVDAFFEEVRQTVGSDADADLIERAERAYMVNRMLQLSILYDALYSGIIVKAGIDIMLMALNRDPGKLPNMDYFREQVRELTGIEVKDATGLKALRDELTRMSDKFSERFPKQERDEAEQTDKPSFLRGVMAVFSIMEMGYNERMTLAEFGELRRLADERRRQLEKQMEKYESKD